MFGGHLQGRESLRIGIPVVLNHSFEIEGECA